MQKCSSFDLLLDLLYHNAFMTLNFNLTLVRKVFMTQNSIIGWFDLPALDVDRAVNFYSQVLGIALNKEIFGEFEMSIFPHSETAVGGCIYKSTDVKPSHQGILLYFNVDGRMEDAQSKVESAQGKIIQAKHAIGQHGFRSLVLDSEGNRIALHSMT